MVRSVKSVSHRGLRDWVWQRLSALVIAAYSIWLVGYFLLSSPVSFVQWHHLFSLLSVKIATIFFLIALLVHAWIGVWTVLTDYVKPAFIRAFLYIVFLFVLSTCFIWGVIIVGGV